MEYQATAKYLRTSTRKLRLVADAVRGLLAEDAIARLSGLTKRAAIPLREVIASAIANAKVKGANTAILKFKTLEVMGGPAMKRWRAVSRGQAHGYKKRMTHVRIVLTDEEVKDKKLKVKNTDKKSKT